MLAPMSATLAAAGVLNGRTCSASRIGKTARIGTNSPNGTSRTFAYDPNISPTGLTTNA